jgi:uncharacterized protein YkwD
MGRMLVVLACAFALLPAVTQAAGSGGLSVRLAHSSLRPNQLQTVSVTAADLSGKPMARAQVSTWLTYSFDSGSRLNLATRLTDSQGRATVSTSIPRDARTGTATVAVKVSAGYLRESGSATFRISGSGASPTSGPKVGKTQIPRPTATPVPTAATSLEVSARVLPVAAVIPEPVWVVILVRSPGGKLEPRAAVSARVTFAEGSVVIHGYADDTGIATLLIDTSRARRTERVSLRVNAWAGKAYGDTLLAFSLNLKSSPKPTATDTATPTATATATPSPTATDPPTPTNTPLPTALPTPTTPAATATPAATSTPAPTSTPTPTATQTFTSTATPLPTPTSTQVPDCPGTAAGCMQAALNMINATRAQYGVQPLTLNMTQSLGTSTCPGSYGHSTAMAATGQIWHQNSNYPAASFPANICVAYSSAGENVGEWGGGSELTEIQNIFDLMMSEPHDATTCSQTDNHACNIISPRFSRIGVGLYYSISGTTWYTTDFLN